MCVEIEVLIWAVLAWSFTCHGQNQICHKVFLPGRADLDELEPSDC